MSTKICRRCGKERPADQFRQYYNREGTYTYCRDCESIEQRRKYLVAKGAAATEQEKHELESIAELYRRREEAGLRVPKPRANKRRITALIDSLLEET